MKFKKCSYLVFCILLFSTSNYPPKQTPLLTYLPCLLPFLDHMILFSFSEHFWLISYQSGCWVQCSKGLAWRRKREHFLPLLVDFLVFKTSGNSEIHWFYSYSEFKMFLEYWIDPSSHVGDPVYRLSAQPWPNCRERTRMHTMCWHCCLVRPFYWLLA